MHRKQKLYVQLVLWPYNYHKMMSARRKEIMEICKFFIGMCLLSKLYIHIFGMCYLMFFSLSLLLG